MPILWNKYFIIYPWWSVDGGRFAIEKTAEYGFWYALKLSSTKFIRFHWNNKKNYFDDNRICQLYIEFTPQTVTFFLYSWNKNFINKLG
jgi:hypothetical protein